MNLKVGETFKLYGTEILVLDIIDGNPFVIALDIGIITSFSKDKNNNYNNSLLKDNIDTWLKAQHIHHHTIPRILDLTTLDGGKCYSPISVKAAPLTFDEWRKYAKIIIPHIKKPFWLATGWANPNWQTWNGSSVCYISQYKMLCPFTANMNEFNAAPALILDKQYLDSIDESNFGYNSLSLFSTNELLTEISRRLKQNPS